MDWLVSKFTWFWKKVKDSWINHCSPFSRSKEMSEYFSWYRTITHPVMNLSAGLWRITGHLFELVPLNQQTFTGPSQWDERQSVIQLYAPEKAWLKMNWSNWIPPGILSRRALRDYQTVCILTCAWSLQPLSLSHILYKLINFHHFHCNHGMWPMWIYFSMACLVGRVKSEAITWHPTKLGIIPEFLIELSLVHSLHDGITATELRFHYWVCKYDNWINSESVRVSVTGDTILSSLPDFCHYLGISCTSIFPSFKTKRIFSERFLLAVTSTYCYELHSKMWWHWPRNQCQFRDSIAVVDVIFIFVTCWSATSSPLLITGFVLSLL